MRIDVKKFLFVGVHTERESFFKKAQEIGLVHFIETGPPKTKEIPQEVQNLVTAIKILRGLPVVTQEELTDYSQADSFAEKILHLKHKAEKLFEEKRVLTLEIARISVFGDFSLDDITYLEQEGNRKIQFYFAKKGAMNPDNLPKELFWIDSDHGLDYFIGINKESTQYDKLVEMRVEQPLAQLKSRLSEITMEIHIAEQELKTYAKYNTFLHNALIVKLNSHNLRTTQDYAQKPLESTLFAVEGWVPEHKIEAVEQLVKDMNVNMAEIAIESKDVVPTYLENKGPSRIGEDLIRIYDTPSNTDKDPSLWVLLSFALFFAMIIGDAGYGLVFLGTALYVRYNFPKMREVGKRVVNLFIILCIATIGWGFLTNSFFGIKFGPKNPVRQYSLIHYLAKNKVDYTISHQDVVYQEWIEKYPHLEGKTDPQEFLSKGVKVVEGKTTHELMDKVYENIFLELSLFIGIVHVCLSFIRYLDRNWSGIGWVIAIIGAYLYIPEYLEATTMAHYVIGMDKAASATEGWYMMSGGFGLAVGIAIFRNRLLGILEITNVIQIFADILSYLRLFALALTGSIISNIVNEFASSMVFVGGVFLALIGHAFNMVLALIGGIIHGLRLNFIEWYHYSFEGGGKPFNPLTKLEIE